MLIVAACALLESRLPKHLSGTNVKALLNTVQLFMRTLQSPSIWRPALYIYLFSGAVCPDINEALFFWLTDPKFGPGFSESFMGLVNALGYIAVACGIILYNRRFKFYSFRVMFFWTQIAVCATGVSDLALVTSYNQKMGIPDHAFILGDRALSSVIGKLQLMPMLVLCAKLCPPGIEGTVFAFLMSVCNYCSLARCLFTQTSGHQQEQLQQPLAGSAAEEPHEVATAALPVAGPRRYT